MRAVPGRLYAAGPDRQASSPTPTFVPSGKPAPQPDEGPVDPRGFAIRTQQKVIAHYRQLLAASKPPELRASIN
jgi:hypothetical protein